MSNDDFNCKAWNVSENQDPVVKLIQICHLQNNYCVKCECGRSSPAWLWPWDWRSAISTRVKPKCYSFVRWNLRLQSERKEEKADACWALKEKYQLWSLKIPVEAQSSLQFWHIVKKQMQQIRTYCSSGGVISLWTVSSTALLMPSWWKTDSITRLFILPQMASVMKSCQWWYGIAVCHLVSSLTNNKKDVSSTWGKGQRVRMGGICGGFPQAWMA